MKQFSYPKDKAAIARFFQKAEQRDRQTEETVERIIQDVRRQGDRAVTRYARKFDGVPGITPGQFRIPLDRLKEAWDGLPGELQRALKLAHRRIRDYHRLQKVKGFTYKDDLGNRMDQRVRPLNRVGVYVPGGTAAYPSTVLMDVVPAKVAGVREIVMLTPPPRKGETAMLASLGAAWLAGVDEVVGLGGAHAVAALCLGTESLKRVDKIVGPGNKYVATAKRMLYGEMDIDMVAGPSEVLILADETASVEHIAADLLSQAEHDPDAQAVAILIGNLSPEAVVEEVKRQTALSPRKAIIRKSLNRFGALIQAPDRETAAAFANEKAPEHLEILTRKPRQLADGIDNVGAIFLGPYTPEPMGDYMAGPNHTLPTGGTARFYSPLSVWSFLKTSHVVQCSRKGFMELADPVIALAEAEGLQAHADAVKVRKG